MSGHTERLSVVVHPGREQPDKRTITLNTIHGEIVGYAAHREMPEDATIDQARVSSITFTEARRNAILWAHADGLARALQRCVVAMQEHNATTPIEDCEWDFEYALKEAQDALRKAGV